MKSLRIAQALVAGSIVTAFPAASMLVFAADMDRVAVANGLAVVYAFGLYLLFSTPWWPLRSLRALDTFERLQQTVMAWFWMTYTTHLTWELGWLVGFDAIVGNPDSPWTYAWWAYIDGGDTRYARFDPNLWTMEILSVTNGLIGYLGLYFWHRRPAARPAAILLWMATAVVHLYATSLYFGGEIFAGFPSVDTSSFYGWGIKFVLANSPWIVMPVFVLIWGWRSLKLELR